MKSNTTWETFVIDKRHLVDAKINTNERSIVCTMLTSNFGPIHFYSEKFEEGIEVDFLSVIFEEAKKFVPKFDELEKQYLNKENAD